MTGNGRLGTFLGVFTPTILTILGVIMYLRLGWVTGQMGLSKTWLIVILANAITLITALSFSAIATNIRVGVGGAYFMISRSLGLEFGGAIGLPLFLSQAFSVTLYAFGLAESFRIFWGGIPVQPVAFLIVLAVGYLAFRGAGLALRAQLPLMALIGLSLLALAAGAFLREPATVMGPAPAEIRPGFWVVFSVFFPAVTGIMAGLGLSGDLRDPIRSIPRGSLAATLTGFVVYLIVPYVLVQGASPEALRQDALIWTRIAPLGFLLVLPGLWGAIFSSAVGSILGAPRTLQALASDGLVPRFLGRVSGTRKEPVVGLVVSLLIALGAVMLGDLDAVAPVVTMFFLTVYGMINLVAALETLSGDSSWRPRLSVPWPICLVGAVACFWVMFLIHPGFATAAIVIELGLWSILARRERRARWGDVRRGIFEALIRWSLVHLSRRPMDARNWRPHVMVFVGRAERRLDLIRFGTWFSQGRGVVTVCELVVGDLLSSEISVPEREKEIQQLLRREGLVAFGEVDVVQDVVMGITNVAQANGMAGLDSNTILVGWPEDRERLLAFLRVAHRLEALDKSMVIGRMNPGVRPRGLGSIDIWWGGLQRNGDLMLLLAHLISRNREWRDADIRVLSVASNEHMRANTEAHLERFLAEARIEATPMVMIRPREGSIREIIHRESKEADLVFLGLDVPREEEKMQAYAERMAGLSGPLGTVFFVKNSSPFGGKLVQTTEVPTAEPEAGESAGRKPS